MNCDAMKLQNLMDSKKVKKSLFVAAMKDGIEWPG